MDQLLYEDLQIEDGSIHIPNPDILDYAFALKPLVDIAGEVLHPTLDKNLQQLWDEFDKDGLEMKVVTLPSTLCE